MDAGTTGLAGARPLERRRNSPSRGAAPLAAVTAGFARGVAPLATGAASLARALPSWPPTRLACPRHNPLGCDVFLDRKEIKNTA